MGFSTPLRYPGGKARLGPWLAELLRHNKISGGMYVEPYAGGAGAAIFLLMHGYVDQILINDVDPVIHAFWNTAVTRPSRLVNLIRQTPVTVKSWLAQKEVLDNSEKFSEVEVGFAAFFLNRTNRSGILRGGLIGGKRQDGPFKLDARYNQDDLIARIEAIGRMCKHITVRNRDAFDFIREDCGELPAKSLTYLDPPYFVKGSQLYRNHYQPDDHERISELVQAYKNPVIVTYDNEPEIKALYSSMAAVEFSLVYSTHARRAHTTEVMFYRNLTLPSIPRMTRASVLRPARSDEGRDIVPSCVDK